MITNLTLYDINSKVELVPELSELIKIKVLLWRLRFTTWRNYRRFEPG